MKTELKYDAECTREPCGCPVGKFGDYCSDWCEKNIVTTDCGC